MFKQVGDKLYRRQDKELLCIEPWGANSFRVRATQRAEFIPDTDSVLLEPEKAQVTIAIDGKKAVITNGKLTCKVMDNGVLQYYNQNGKLLLEEYDRTRDMYAGSDKFASAL